MHLRLGTVLITVPFAQVGPPPYRTTQLSQPRTGLGGEDLSFLSVSSCAWWHVYKDPGYGFEDGVYFSGRGRAFAL